MAGLERTLTTDTNEAHVDPGEEKIHALSVPIEALGKSRLLDNLQETTD